MGSASRRARAPERATPSRSAPSRSSQASKSPAPAPSGAGLAVATGTFDIGPALSADDLLHLQRTAGNRAVSAAIQRVPGDDDDSYARINTNQVGKDAVTAAPMSLPPVTNLPGGGKGPAYENEDPEVIVPVGAGRNPPRSGGQVPAGYGGNVDQRGRNAPPKNAVSVPDATAIAAYRKDPASVFRSPSDDWHYQLWHFQIDPKSGQEDPPPVFRAGNIIAVAPGHPVPATPIPSSYTGVDRDAPAATPTPLDDTTPKPERPMTRAVAPGTGGAPGFGGTPGSVSGPETPGRQTAQAMSTPDVLAAIKADPGRVWRSPSAEWHAQMYQLDKGKGSTTPTAYRVGDLVVIAPDHPLKGVPTLAVPGMAAPAGGPPGGPAPTAIPNAPTGGGTDGGRRTRTDVNVTKGAPGVKGEVMVEDETTRGDTTTRRGRGATGSLGGPGNVASLGAQDVRTRTTGDTATTANNSANLALKPDGSLVLGGERKVETFKGKDDAGNPIKTGGTAVNANLGLSDKGVTGQVGAVRETAGGNKVGGNLSATFDDKGNMSAQAALKIETKGGTSLTPTVSGGVAVQASDPTPAEGGGWDVTYTVTTTEGKGLGVGKQSGGGSSVGVQLGSTEGTLETGSRHFDDEKKAKAFRDKAAQVVAGERFMLYPPPTTVAGALLIPIGEERGSGDLSGSNYGASVAFEGASLGYGRSSSTTHQFKVKRMSQTVVHVTGEVSGTKGSDVSGGGGITLTRGSSNTKGFAVVWEIDLGSKAGKDAFELYAKTGYPPVGAARLVSMTSSGSEEDHDGVSIPLLGTARWTGTTWEVIKTDDKGEHKQFGGQQAHDQDPSWIGGHILGQDTIHSTAGITSNLETDRQGKQAESYQARITVSGTSGEDSREELGRIFMGVAHAGTAKASGEWTLTANVSADVVRELERVNKDMREAKTREDKMRVYSALVKERGAKMVGAQVGLGGDATAWTLELKGDKNFPGPAGRAELERKRAAFKERLGKDPAGAKAVVKEVQQTLDELRARRIAVKDETRYTDLPGGLRDEQLKLIDKHISDFEAIRHKALRDAVKGEAPAKPEAAKGGPADQGGYKNDQNAAESADMVKLRTQIDQKETAISALDPRINRAIYAVTQASKHTANVPTVYGGWLMSHRADYNTHWATGININERQVALAPRIDALRQKLVESLFAVDRKAAAEALLAQLTDRLSLLEALHMEVVAAAEALKPTTTANGMKGYPKFWGSIKGDEPPWGGFGSDEE